VVRLFKTIAGLRSVLEGQWQQQNIGFVPTMGALHSGHLSLIKRAVAENDLVVVSIFVNPLQFGPNEDLAKYPRQLENDCQLCEEAGVNLIFAPSVTELYGKEPTTQVLPPPEMLSILCGPWREGHFQGVATVVTKLLNIVQPTIAYFGQKDAQQLAIIKRLVADLNLPVEIRGCPTVREESGLACSSRNQYLTPEAKERALALSRGLKKAKEAFSSGQRDGNVLISLVRSQLGDLDIEYVELVHPQTLQPLGKIEEAGLIAIAARVDSTRLIDNVILRDRQPIIAIDGPAGAGKSTVTRRVAQALNLLYLDTGAMYRAVTWLVMQSGLSVADESSIAELVSGVKLELIPAADVNLPTRIEINGQDVTDAIRSSEVTANVSAIAAQPTVRRELVKLQQHFGAGGGIIAEGRDIGTHVFPDAELKIFLTASVAERARRRWEEFKNRGEIENTLEQLERDIQERDYNDSHRKIAPLKQAVDAIKVDTDKLTIDQVTEKIISLHNIRFGRSL
jgi:pantoate ligase/cytidylate kinase